MSTFYVRVYKPNFNKAYRSSASAIPNEFTETTRYFSEMFLFICNKYSVRDAYFLYNNQRVFISKLGTYFFDYYLNWEQFNITHMQLWFINVAKQAAGQWFYKTQSYVNNFIYYNPTLWLTSDIVFTENSTNTKTIDNGSARVFSCGKTIISLINESIEPEAYSAPIPYVTGIPQVAKNRANNIPITPTGTTAPYDYYYSLPNADSFCVAHNQTIIKSCTRPPRTSDIVAAFVRQENSINTAAYIRHNDFFVFNPYGYPGNESFPPGVTNFNTQFRAGNYWIGEHTCLRNVSAAGFNVYPTGAPIDVIYLAKRPILGNLVVPNIGTGTVSSDTTAPIEWISHPKRLVNVEDIPYGTINTTTGGVDPSNIARYLDIVINNTDDSAGNILSRLDQVVLPTQAGEKWKAYFKFATDKYFILNTIASPTRYVQWGLSISLEKNSTDKTFAKRDLATTPFVFDQFVSWDILVNLYNTNFGRITLLWDNGINFANKLDVPLKTNSYLRIAPWIAQGDSNSFATNKKYPSPLTAPLYQTPSHPNLTKRLYRNIANGNPFVPYMINSTCFVNECNSYSAIQNSLGVLATTKTDANLEIAIPGTNGIKIDNTTNLTSNTKSDKMNFANTFDNWYKNNTTSLGGRYRNPQNIITAENKAFQVGIRMQAATIDYRLYYKFKKFPVGFLKIPLANFPTWTFSQTIWQIRAPTFTFTFPTDPIEQDTAQVIPNVTTAEDFNRLTFLKADFPGDVSINLTQQEPILLEWQIDTTSSFPLVSFTLGFYDPNLNKTIAVEYLLFFTGNTTRIIRRASLIYKNYYQEPVSIAGNKTDSGNVTNNFAARKSTLLKTPWNTVDYYYTRFFFTTAGNALEYETRPISITQKLPFNFTEAALIVQNPSLPVLNSSGLTVTSILLERRYMLTSNMFETSRGQLLPSFISNNKNDDQIIFRKVSQLDNFSIYSTGEIAFPLYILFR